MPLHMDLYLSDDNLLSSDYTVPESEGTRKNGIRASHSAGSILAYTKQRNVASNVVFHILHIKEKKDRAIREQQNHANHQKHQRHHLTKSTVGTNKIAAETSN